MQPTSSVEISDGLRSVVYFVDWAIYARNYTPQNLPADKLTHVLYAFAGIDARSGEVSLKDSWADIEKHFPGDPQEEGENNVYGCVKQLFLIKKRNRNLKVLLSVGGWADSHNFAHPASSEVGRSTFAETVTRLVLDLGFDGVDIDWEYPEDDNQAKDLVELLRSVRKASVPSLPHTIPRPNIPQALDGAGAGRRFLLTAAVSAGPEKFKKLRLSEMTPLLDFYNLMAYDYVGNWPGSRMAGHQANIKPAPDNRNSTPFSSSAAIEYYTGAGKVPASKIVLGMPLYGRVFANTNGPGSPFSGGGDGYSWEVGVWDYKVLPRQGAREHTDKNFGASWSYDVDQRQMVSYDTVPMVVEKSRYIVESGLGGAMWWEASGDKGGANDSLIATYVNFIRGNRAYNLENMPNALNFPDSRYANLKAGFPGE
ncbi:endochitinase 1 [Arthroderma uncinatum]|uniref:endochitinase 1 n=1 Tax=Arthroderma uncinatum TaxID=74035 RepID=UPI00144AAB37|nr:endochitinase 1 [Arthroderma uncinatum]KAF3484288.1 endochitinase 1 [Arthroderma uncinatum]